MLITDIPDSTKVKQPNEYWVKSLDGTRKQPPEYLHEEDNPDEIVEDLMMENFAEEE